MFIVRRKKILKELETERKRVSKVLKGYEKSLVKLQKERDRVASFKTLSPSEKQMQYDFIDDRIGKVKVDIDRYTKLLKKLSEDYKKAGGSNECQ